MAAVPCSCCSDPGYRRMFGARVAALDGRRYRRRGLGETAASLVRLAGAVEGASVLEVGGGVGAIEIELLQAGAARATNVELSDSYEAEAAALLRERGLESRVERRLGDFVLEQDALAPHDLVVLHRVVCCYPDVEALLGAAAERAGRRLVLTYPQERRWIRLGSRLANGWFRLRRCGFRTYVHPFAEMLAVAARHGLALEARERHGLLWESAALVRS